MLTHDKISAGLLSIQNVNGLTMRSLQNSAIELNVNHFQLLPRLSQTYLVDQVSRAIDYRLQWNKNSAGSHKYVLIEKIIMLSLSDEI